MHQRQSGFTLIELLIIIAVIGILVAAVIANMNKAKVRAFDTRALSCAQQLRGAQTTEQTRNGEFGAFSDLKTPACAFLSERPPGTEAADEYLYQVRHPKGSKTYLASDKDLRWTPAMPADSITMADGLPLGGGTGAGGSGNTGGGNAGGGSAGGGSAPLTEPNVDTTPKGNGTVVMRFDMMGAPLNPTLSVRGPADGVTVLNNLLEEAYNRSGTYYATTPRIPLPAGQYSVTVTYPASDEYPTRTLVGDTSVRGEGEYGFFTSYLDPSIQRNDGTEESVPPRRSNSGNASVINMLVDIPDGGSLYLRIGERTGTNGPIYNE